LFGTDEFIAFCRAVGCEPMICVNAGDGTPEEAARWIEYCNGPADSPMGRLRAANGHAEPFNVRHWEVGNELWGRWQFHWTTATGNVERYRRFAKAMLAADPTILLYACGAPVFWAKAWNDTPIAGVGAELRSITDHPLVGGNVALTADPLDVFRDFMAVPGVLETKWGALRDDLARAGIREARLAVTELQVFAHLGSRGDTNLPVRLTRDNLPAQGSMTEALYDILLYHTAVRLQPFVEMITHSATVNHGGGLRKERERVYANPCHYAQALFAEFAEATPVAITLDAPAQRAPLVLPELRNVTQALEFKAVDALAAVAPNGELLVSLVNGTMNPVALAVELKDFPAAAQAVVISLSAGTPWAGNSLERPRAVEPQSVTVALQGSRLELELEPCSVTQVRVPVKRD
jgi:alpha-N-arabinofuranosidase